MKIIDYFIHPSLSEDRELNYYSRVVAALALTYIGLMLVMLLLVIIANFFAQAYTLFVAAGFLALLAILFSLCLWSLRTFGQYYLCCHFLVAAIAMGILGGILTTGGAEVSPSTALLVIPIILSFMLLGQKGGILWGTTIIICHILIVMLGQFIDIPSFIDMRFIIWHHFLHWVVNYFAVLSLLYLYSSFNQRLKTELKYVAQHDSLTRLANRAQFDDYLSRSCLNDEIFALLYIDLDGFKPINDQYGHAVGDKVLQVVGLRMQQHIRDNDFVARLGGDEFAVIAQSVDTIENAKQITATLSEVISQTIQIDDLSLTVSSSIGIAIYKTHATNAADLLRIADEAMYHSKSSGEAFTVYGR